MDEKQLVKKHGKVLLSFEVKNGNLPGVKLLMNYVDCDSIVNAIKYGRRNERSIPKLYELFSIAIVVKIVANFVISPVLGYSRGYYKDMKTLARKIGVEDILKEVIISEEWKGKRPYISKYGSIENLLALEISPAEIASFIPSEYVVDVVADVLSHSGMHMRKMTKLLTLLAKKLTVEELVNGLLKMDRWDDRSERDNCIGVLQFIGIDLELPENKKAKDLVETCHAVEGLGGTF